MQPYDPNSFILANPEKYLQETVKTPAYASFP